MDKKTISVLFVLFIIAFIVFYVLHTSTYESFKGTYNGYNLQPALGYNIFFSDRDQVLFLHGDDYRLTELLENHLEKGKAYTFYTWKETTGCGTNVGCQTWYNYMEIRDDIGTRIHGKYGWEFK